MTTPEIAEQERLITLLEKKRHEALAALQATDDGAIVYADEGADPWRVQDVLGHIATWEREVLATVQAFHEGDAYSLGEGFELEAYNQAKFRQRRDYAAAQIRMDWAMVRRDLQHALHDLAPERFGETLRFPWGEEGTISQMVEGILAHEAHHLRDIVAVGGWEGSS